MVEGCSSQTSKILLIIFNAFFLLFGIGVIATGFLGTSTISELATLDPHAQVLRIAVWTIGSVVCIVSLFGLFGACCENTCLIGTYAGFLILLVVLEIFAIIAVFVFRPAIEKQIKKSSEAVWKGRHDDKDAFWTAIQFVFKCCGKDGPRDYRGSRKPDSCCSNLGLKEHCTDSSKTLHKEGCVNAVITYLRKHYLVQGLIAGGVCLYEILGITLAFCLIKGIKNSAGGGGPSSRRSER